MGEHEVGGMLRTVLTIGLATIVVTIVVSLLMWIRNSTSNNTAVVTKSTPNLALLNNGSVAATITNYHSSGIQDTGNGEGKIVIAPKNDKLGTGRGTGFYVGVGGNSSNKDNASLYVGDKWQAGIDLKTNNPSALKFHEFFVEGSDNWQWDSKPALSTDWRHYSSHGTRNKLWGTWVVYLYNTSDKPVTIWVRNLNLQKVV